MSTLNESVVENAALTWFGEPGYSCLGVEALTPTLSHGERGSYGNVVLVGRLREAIWRLNPAMPEEARAIFGIIEKFKFQPEGRRNHE